MEGEISAEAVFSPVLSSAIQQKLEEYRCPVCIETFIQPCKLNCPSGHTFCTFCIQQWKAKTKKFRHLTCPLCRGFVQRGDADDEPESWVTLPKMESEITRFFGSLPLEFQKERRKALEERKIEERELVLLRDVKKAWNIDVNKWIEILLFLSLLFLILQILFYFLFWILSAIFPSVFEHSPIFLSFLVVLLSIGIVMGFLTMVIAGCVEMIPAEYLHYDRYGML